MSPRAACRLESLGFTAVFDYTAGKADWLAAGLPTEGPSAATPRPGGLAGTPAPTCALDDTVDTARQRASAAGDDRCVVVSEAGVVLGLLDRDLLAGDGDGHAGDVMREGPTTVRADEDLMALTGRMHDHNVTTILVTDPDGRVLGLLHRHLAEMALIQANSDDNQPAAPDGPAG